MTEPVDNTGPLKGIRVLDLTRILAGPTCTQLLGDLGCDVIKVERPGDGDDTRHWGPNYLKDVRGEPTKESAYFLCANRSKRSVTIDFSQAKGRDLVIRLLAHADVLAHNFKVGGLEKFGLGYADLKDRFPGLVYCSVTGFGQTGPYAPRPGYDYLAQGMGGIMSVTGDPDGPPMKVGVGIADVMCGMYATVAVLAALRHRDVTGEGQHIDVALLDTQVAWLINEGLNYLTSGRPPVRLGVAHPNVVPYQTFETSDGYFILACGNDAQFRRFWEFAGAPERADDPRFASNDARIANRPELARLIGEVTKHKPTRYWLDGLAKAGVPAGPVNTIPEALADPHVRHRGMVLEMPHPATGGGTVKLLGNPIKLSASPVAYRDPPPMLGQHTEEVLTGLLKLSKGEIDALRAEGVI
jgi:crotonobetainyl-CoA:carnitine CoA-transferase CaiB-like acyl-CoA transferase